jgi:NAD(P)-dependent dehydrogenase (short-subunit alcohol dehydrogenase family)
MATRLSDRVAVVTGGTRGIGRAIAERLLDEGAAVAICGRSRESVDAAARELTPKHRDVVFLDVADVAQAEQVNAFFKKVNERFGRLDILVNNAGVGVHGGPHC